MNPLILIMVQFLQALGLFQAVQTFIIAILAMIVLFMAINYFRSRM